MHTYSTRLPRFGATSLAFVLTCAMAAVVAVPATAVSDQVLVDARGDQQRLASAEATSGTGDPGATFADLVSVRVESGDWIDITVQWAAPVPEGHRAQFWFRMDYGDPSHNRGERWLVETHSRSLGQGTMDNLLRWESYWGGSGSCPEARIQQSAAAGRLEISLPTNCLGHGADDPRGFDAVGPVEWGAEIHGPGWLQGTPAAVWRDTIGSTSRSEDTVDMRRGRARPADAAAPATLPDGNGATTERLDFTDPAAAAVAISQARFPADYSASHAVVARWDRFPDALAASALAGEGPLILIDPALEEYYDSIIELKRVVNGPIFLAGGPNAISSEVADKIASWTGITPTRLAGANRFATAAVIADKVRELYPDNTEAMIARGYGPDTDPNGTAAWADALAAGAWAAESRTPILLTRTGELSAEAGAWLNADQPSRTVVLGGPSAVNESVAVQTPHPHRVAGANRSATAIEIARQLWGQADTGPGAFVVVDLRGLDGWAFGLPASGLGMPMLGVDGGAIHPDTMSYLRRCGGQAETFILGSRHTIPVAHAAALHAADSC